MKTIKKAITVIISVVLWVLILLAALYAFTTLATRDNNNVANFLGYTPMIVESDSMAPEFYKGDLILIKKTDPSTPEVGDVICFHAIIENQYALNTHRIVEITNDGLGQRYTTKGDNNTISDLHIISEGDIVGKYLFSIPKLGNLMNVLSSSTGFLIIIVLPMLLFLLYQVYNLVLVSIKLKKAVAIEAAQEAAKLKTQEIDKQTREAKRQAAEAMEEVERLRAQAERLKADAKKEG